MIRSLQKVDDRTFNAGMLGADPKGIYFPSKKNNLKKNGDHSGNCKQDLGVVYPCFTEKTFRRDRSFSTRK